MVQVEKGMMAWSKAGHDKGTLYVIVGMDREYAYLSDGRIRPLENPKKKRWKHIQIMNRIPEELKTVSWDSIRNEEIKRSIKLTNQELFRR